MRMADLPLEHVVQMLESITGYHNVDREHGNRVASLAVDFGRRLPEGQKLDEQKLKLLEYAARLHDFGRVGVGNEIISKPGKLTDSQRGAMETHPRIGYEMTIHLPPEIRLTMLYHHENWDGTGYPRGLKGLDIPLFSRIVRIVDVWDALLSDRPYRKGYSREMAIHIFGNMESHFDPNLLSLFRKMEDIHG